MVEYCPPRPSRSFAPLSPAPPSVSIIATPTFVYRYAWTRPGLFNRTCTLLDPQPGAPVALVRFTDTGETMRVERQALRRVQRTRTDR
jgi:hypothetical protein